MEINLNNCLKEPVVEVFKNGVYQFTISSSVQCDFVRFEIKRLQADGYSFLYNNQFIPVDKNGRIEYQPKGFYDQCEFYLYKLI